MIKKCITNAHKSVFMSSFTYTIPNTTSTITANLLDKELHIVCECSNGDAWSVSLPGNTVIKEIDLPFIFKALQTNTFVVSDNEIFYDIGLFAKIDRNGLNVSYCEQHSSRTGPRITPINTIIVPFGKI